jgi:hypothetical protein
VTRTGESETSSSPLALHLKYCFQPKGKKMSNTSKWTHSVRHYCPGKNSRITVPHLSLRNKVSEGVVILASSPSSPKAGLKNYGSLDPPPIFPGEREKQLRFSMFFLVRPQSPKGSLSIHFLRGNTSILYFTRRFMSIHDRNWSAA